MVFDAEVGGRRRRWWPEGDPATGRVRLEAIGLAVAAVAAIGIVDYATGPLWSMSAFYLIPAAWVTGAVGRRAGVGVAILSGASGMLSDVLLQPRYRHRDVAAWNVAVMLVTLMIVVELVHRMRQRALAASDAERRGREFLDFAAHQLRTPLASMRSTVEALVVNDDSYGDNERLLAGLGRETARAGRLVNSLLRVARLDQHEPLPLRHANLADVARVEVDRASSAWPAVAWSLEAEPSGADMLCNPDAIAEAISILLDNAHRHARARVTVTVQPFGDRTDIAVNDDGPGLPAGNDEVAFQRFVSLDGHGGSGLGLPIARGIAEAHRGSLILADGSFVIRLPRLTRSLATQDQRTNRTIELERIARD